MDKFGFPVIIDTDIGDDIDDTWTLMFILCCKKFDVKMIVLTNFDTEYKANLMAKMLDLLDISIPIVVMPSSNMQPNYKKGQQKWIQDFDIKNYKGKVVRQNQLEYIKTAIDCQKTCIFELAPNTTLAQLATKYPQLSSKYFVYAMAGAINSSYESLNKVVGEFNITCDKQSSKIVFDSDVNYTMLPLDVCAKIRISGELYKQFISKKSLFAQIIQQNYKLWIDDGFFENFNDYGRASSVLFDLIVPFYALFPQNFEIEYSKIHIDENGLTVVGSGKDIAWAKSVKNMNDMLEYLVKLL